MADMQGRNYRALRRLSTADDTTLALVGETCERVPASSLPALLASGKIEAVPTPAVPAAGRTGPARAALKRTADRPDAEDQA